MTKLLPRIDFSATAVAIDANRAAAGLGAQRTVSGSLSVSQVIFSEPAFADIAIQKHLHLSRSAQLDAVTLDIALMSALAYVDVLRARALVKVQKNNLKKTRSNLQLARVRQTLGAGAPSEVYRWEAQYAVSRKQLLDVQNHMKIAQIHLNRILHIPMAKRFTIGDTGLDSPFLTSRDKRFFAYIENPWIARLFLEFWVEHGLKNAPELASVDASIKAKKRQIKMSLRKFFMPTLSFQAGITSHFDRSGAGTQERDISQLFPVFNQAQLLAMGSLFPEKPGHIDMNFGLQLSMPVFAGGERLAVKKKVDVELKKLETDRQMIAELLEEKIRVRAGFAWTANAKIPLSYKAAKASAKTLELVTDAYSRGAISILDLIDAQDAALAADRAAANAVYDFLTAMFNAQRSVNRLDFLTRTSSQMLMLDQFATFLKEKGVVLKKKK